MISVLTEIGMEMILLLIKTDWRQDLARPPAHRQGHASKLYFTGEFSPGSDTRPYADIPASRVATKGEGLIGPCWLRSVTAARASVDKGRGNT